MKTKLDNTNTETSDDLQVREIGHIGKGVRLEELDILGKG